MDFRQLFPKPGRGEIEALLGDLSLAQRAPGGRPFTVANFVASADGRATFQGRSGALGDDGDLAVFRALRHEVDAVLVGTGTLRVERYGRLIKDRAARERRSRRGLTPEPIACMMSRTGRIPLDIPLFAEPEARVVVFTGSELDVQAVAADVDVVELGPGELTFATALSRLRQDYGVRALLCEGGPGVLGALLRERLLDELCLTVAPKLTAGDSPAITSGPELPEPQALVLESVLERAGSLFLRYAIST